MTGPSPQYLEAKRSVDERALDGRVWETFLDTLQDAGSSADAVSILEIGGGIGSMIPRIVAADRLPPAVTYRMIDLEERNVEYAQKRLPEWLESVGCDVEQLEASASSERATFLARSTANGGSNEGRTVRIHLETGDGFSESVVERIDGRADAVVAAAVLDVVDLERALERLPSLVRDGGVVYAPLTYDGLTGFAPVDPRDERLLGLYDRHMDELREKPGGSRTGRRLLAEFDRPGYELLVAGGSDWVVRPREGDYPAEEATFLRTILETIDRALAEYPENVLAPSVRTRWIDDRVRQFERGELSLIAHNLDVLARVGGDGSDGE